MMKKTSPPSANLLARRRHFLAVMGAALVTSTGALAATAPPPAATGPVAVLASTTILQDWVQQVGGDAVTVQTLIGPDSDPHVFQPSPRDAQRVAQADVLVLNGLGLEGWQQRLISSSHFRGKLVVASDHIKALTASHEAHGDDHGHGDEHGHGGSDPHYWQDPSQAVIAVRNIAQGLSQVRPALAAQFQERAKAYIDRLQRLDAAARARFNAIDAKKRRIVTSHDAFGYFGRAYGVQLIALTGWTSASTPSAKTVARVITQLRQQHAQALFLENISDPRLIEQISRETGVRVGGTLYSDALSKPGTAADSYLKLIAVNASTLLAALEPRPLAPLQP